MAMAWSAGVLCRDHWRTLLSVEEGLQKVIFLFFAFIPVVYEAWTDRKGEQRKDKIVDAGLLVGYTVLLTGCAYLVLKNWIAVPLLILMFRISCFDYIVNAFLKRYSGNHNHINIWKYVGKTSFTDRNILSRIPWRIRLLVRVLILVVSVLWFVLSGPQR